MSTAAAKTVATDAPVVEAMVAQLVEVTSDVFSTMLGQNVEFGQPSYTGPQPTANVVATVGFAGTLSGYISLCVSLAAALEIAQALLGSVRTLMTDRGETLGISTPIVTVGTDFSTAALRDVSQAVCPFKMGAHNLFVHLVLQGKGRT